MAVPKELYTSENMLELIIRESLENGAGAGERGTFIEGCKFKTKDQIRAALRDVAGRAYTRSVEMIGNAGWTARVAEFDGCVAEGDSPVEALEALEEDLEEWVLGRLVHGEEIPEPNNVVGYSGKFMVRVAKTLHRDLARCAEREDVSLNAFINHHLTRAVC